ncbi:MAG: permease [Chloroflexi bacterium]|nr:permease [Chloroflexota bacterium]
MKKYFKKIRPYITLLVFAVFILVSFVFQFQPGKTITANFTDSLIEMITFIPFLFIIVGLFDVWVPKEKIQRHIGQESGIKGIGIVILLAMLQAGPLYGAFPVASMLYKKGASIKNIFIYLGAFASLKIPMLGIEIGYLGIKFTLVRTLVSLPLFIGIGYLMEWYLKDKNFVVHEL